MEDMPPGPEQKEPVNQEFEVLDAKVAKLKNFLDERRPPEEQKFYRGVLLVTYLGVFFVIALLIPTAIGWYFDSFYKTVPFGTIIGMIIGLAAGGSGCYKIVKSYWERL